MLAIKLCIVRSLTDILTDLAVARQEKKWAGKDLAEVLANFKF
ncbi:hypothetical protein [uncultured Nostoc sp.]